jgi:O-acetyl-ADP-ribose deacetylase
MLELDTALWPIEKSVGSIGLSLRRADLTLLQVDAIVHYAREDLNLSAGRGRLIRMRGGPAVETELKAIGRVAMGSAVATSGGKLRAARIIHACGPAFREPQLEEKYRRCMYSAIFLADALRVKTLAFPPMGAGFYGIPLGSCAEWMMSAIKTAAGAGTQLKTIILCVMDRREYGAFKEALKIP